MAPERNWKGRPLSVFPEGFETEKNRLKLKRTFIFPAGMNGKIASYQHRCMTRLALAPCPGRKGGRLILFCGHFRADDRFCGELTSQIYGRKYARLSGGFSFYKATVFVLACCTDVRFRGEKAGNTGICLPDWLEIGKGGSMYWR